MSAVAELQRTRKLIPRMPGRGDLWIVLDPPRVLLRADQVEQLAGIRPWLADALFDLDWDVIGDHEYYTLEVATARCEAADTPSSAAFLGWLREQIELLLDDDVIDPTHDLPSHMGSYQVRTAARILSADPGVTIGQTGLFAHMHALGWLDRVDDTWAITPLARANGWLTPREVWLPRPAAAAAGSRSYFQTYVTPAGLEQLRVTLHDPTLTPGPGAQPALF